MAKFDFKKLVNDSADKLKNGAQKAQEAVKEFDIKTAAGDVMTKGKDAAEYFKQKTDETVQAVSQAVRKKEEVTRALAKSLGLLFVSIFCVRLAVGLYLADGALVKEPNGLNLFETALDSAVHSLQTFSMDEGYTDYLFAGRDLWQWMSGSAAAVTLAGMYISLQNLLAPIAGGAILLDLLSNLFPWLRYHLQGGRRKYVFSELNEPAVLLAEDLVRAEQGVRQNSS